MLTLVVEDEMSGLPLVQLATQSDTQALPDTLQSAKQGPLPLPAMCHPLKSLSTVASFQSHLKCHLLRVPCWQLSLSPFLASRCTKYKATMVCIMD
jgi:hypothetical protein